MRLLPYPLLFLGTSLALIQSTDCAFATFDDTSWPQFRGPNGNGLASANTSLPTDLANKENQVWSTHTHGIGWSSPVISNGQVWFTSAIATKSSRAPITAELAADPFADLMTMAQSVEFHAICLDVASGKLLHDIVLATSAHPAPINPMNSYASPTPAIVGERVICHFGNYGTWCLNTNDGKAIWSTKLVVDYSVGPGSSPIVFGNKVLLVCNGIDQQYVAAVNLEDGTPAWKTNWPPLRAIHDEFKKAYSTPLVIQAEGRAIAVVPGAQWTVAYNPETGDELWRVDCGDGFSTTPMAIYESGVVVISTGYMKPAFVAIHPEGSGDVTKTHTAWRASKGVPTMPSAVACNGTIYAISDAGILTSYDATNGNELAHNRIGGNFSASPILAGDLLYLADRAGVVTVVKADKDLTVVSKSNFDSPILASPAIIGNDLILRTEDAIIRITSK